MIAELQNHTTMKGLTPRRFDGRHWNRSGD